MSTLKGRLIAITGAASGIGRTTATLLFKAGALLSLADINEDALSQFVAELGGRGHAYHDLVWWQKVDVTNREQVDDWMRMTVKFFEKELYGEWDSVIDL
jgi:NADP-dependent 3-hydroxy acid dehydrogenase YdfG